MATSSSFCFVLGLLVCVAVTGTSGSACEGIKCSDAFGDCLFDETQNLFTAFEVSRGAKDEIDDYVMLSYNAKSEENPFKGGEQVGWEVEETSEGVTIRLVSKDALPITYSAAVGQNCHIKVYPVMIQSTESRPNQLLPVLPPTRTREDVKSLASHLSIQAKFSAPVSVDLAFKTDSPDYVFVGMEMGSDSALQELPNGESISFPAVDTDVVNQDFEVKFILYAKRFAMTPAEVDSPQSLNLLLTRSYNPADTDLESDENTVQECKAFSLVTKPARFLFTRDYDSTNTLLQSNVNTDLRTLSRHYNHEKFECHRISCPAFAQDSFSFGLELTDDSITAEPDENLPAAILYNKAEAVKSGNSHPVFRDVYFEKSLLDAEHGFLARCDDPKVYGGNVLVTPPVPTNRYGLIVFGTNGDSLRSLDAATTVGNGHEYDQIKWHRFVKAQQVQYPYLEVDIEYMSVGHVDEVFSFVAQDGGNHIEVLVSDPKLGLELLLGKLQELSRSEPTAEPVPIPHLKGSKKEKKEKSKKKWQGIKFSNLFSGILKRKSASPSASTSDESIEESGQVLFDALTNIQTKAADQIAKAKHELKRQLKALGVEVAFRSLPTLFAFCRNGFEESNAELLRPLLPNLVNHIQIPEAEPNRYKHLLPTVTTPEAKASTFDAFYFGDSHEEAVAQLDKEKTVDFIYGELQTEFMKVASKVISELKAVYNDERVVRSVDKESVDGIFWGGGDLHCGTKLCKLPRQSKAKTIPADQTKTLAPELGLPLTDENDKDLQRPRDGNELFD
eukprot:GILK01001353.1.p1 GENE.GILK01001353.1~~GILK01001353.1.p1  ORF type:complete len:801 (-),score=149.72 GILK01001353.1:124-2481(-)